MQRILLVEDNTEEARATAVRLERVGYAVNVASEGMRALRELYQCRPELVVLDLALSDIDGFEACRLIRAISDLPIIVVSGLSDEEAVVRCLDLGADEYLVKPVGTQHLVSRIQAVLRRTKPSPSSGCLYIGEVEIDIERRLVRRGETRVPLTPTEFRLLEALGERAGRPCTRQYLLERVWGTDYGDALHYLRLYIGYLRQKLEDDPRHPAHILNEWGIGYRLQVDGGTPGRPDRSDYGLVRSG